MVFILIVVGRIRLEYYCDLHKLFGVHSFVFLDAWYVSLVVKNTLIDFVVNIVRLVPISMVD